MLHACSFEVLSEQVHFDNPTVLQWIKKYQEPDLHYPLMVLFPIVHKTWKDSETERKARKGGKMATQGRNASNAMKRTWTLHIVWHKSTDWWWQWLTVRDWNKHLYSAMFCNINPLSSFLKLVKPASLFRYHFRLRCKINGVKNDVNMSNKCCNSSLWSK